MTTATFLQHLVRQLRHTTAAAPSDCSSDADLLRRFQQYRDPHALEAIVRRYGNCVLSACRKVLATEADVEDAFQATFVVLLQHANSIRQGQALGGWLSCVAHRVALRALTNAVRRQRVEQCQQRAVAEAPDLSWREACAILHEELDKLPDQYRRPLILCYLEGKSRDETAQQLGVTTDALRGRLDRGRERLRGRLLKRGIALSAGLLAATANSVTARGLPEHLLRATLTAAITGPLPASVAALLRGTVFGGTLGKFKLLAVVVLVFGLLSGGVGLGMLSAPPAMEPPQANRTQPPAAPPAVAEPEKVPDPNHKAVAVSGKVIGPDGKPVPKARLFVFDADQMKPAPQAQAGADGAFTFELPPPAGGWFRYLVATAPDFGLGCDWVQVAAVDATRDAVLKLPKDEPVKGRVVDLEGQPVAGATVRVTDLETGPDDTLDEFVRLWSKDFEQQQQAYGTLTGKRLFARKALAAHFTTTSDKDGRFTLTGIGRDRCPQLTVSARGKASLVCVVAIRPDFKPAPGGLTGSPVVGPEFTVPLAPSVAIRGVVRDADKKPLASVRVRGQAALSEPFRPGYLIRPDVEAVTDADGRYTLDGLPTGKQYTLVADPRPGDGSVRRFVTREDGPGVSDSKVDFDLPRGVVLTGRVTDKKTGQPLRAHVFYRPLRSNKWPDKHPGYESHGLAPECADDRTWSDPDGRYQLTVIPGPGILHVQVLDADGTTRQYMTAKLAAEDDNSEVLQKDFGSMKLFNTRGQGGYFSLSNVHAYRVLRLAADATTATADATVDPGVRRAVQVVGADGKPVRGAWVMNDRVFGGTSKPLAGAEFTVYALDPEQPRTLYAQQDDKKLAGFLTLDGKDTGPALLKLQAMATVTGRLLDQDGRPLKECRLSPSYEDPEIGLLLNSRDRYNTTPTVTDAEGRFTLHVAAGLAVRIAARTKSGKSTGHETAKRTLKAGATLDLGDWKPK